MYATEIINETVIINDILPKGNLLFIKIKDDTIWDSSIISRKTCSYGKPYNYSNINYQFVEFPKYISDLASIVESKFAFLPNNCLINYYNDGNSKMGFHSDQINLLSKDSGIAIFSLGSSRILRFKNKNDNSIIHDIILHPNSLFFMSKKIQQDWLHSLLNDKNDLSNSRISITFRKLK